MNKYLKKIKKEKLYNSVVVEFALPSPESIKSIAIMYYWGGVGDNLMYTGIYKGIKEKFVNAQIDVYCRDFCKELYNNNPYIDEVIGFLPDGGENYFISLMQDKQYDLLLYNHYYTRSEPHDFIAFHTPAKIKIGWLNGMIGVDVNYYRIKSELDKIYTYLLPDLYQNRKAMLLENMVYFLKAIGINKTIQDIAPQLYISNSTIEFARNIFSKYDFVTKNTIVVVMSAGKDGQKITNYSDFGKVLTNIQSKHNYNIIALGAENDYVYAEKQLSKYNIKFVNLCGKTTLLQAAAIIKNVRLVFGLDTGLLHIACAVGTPNVVIMSCTRVGVWFPYSALTSAVFLPIQCMNCEKTCIHNFSICVQKIKPESLEYAIDWTLNNELKNPRVFYEADRDDLFPAKWQKFTQSYFNENVELIEIPLKNITTTNSTPLVSVIMPLYNYEKYVIDAINSVINQTYKNWELIIVDDCSTDDSYNVVKSYIKTLPNYNIQLHQNEQNVGSYPTSNNAIKYANGEYIFRFDADDMLAPTMLEQFMEVYANNDVDIVTCSEQYFGDMDFILECSPPALYKYSQYCSCIWRLMYRKDMWAKVGGYYEGIKAMADWELASRYYSAGYTKSYTINKPLYLYRKHGFTLLNYANNNQTEFKAKMVLNNRSAYHKYYVMWAQGVLAGNEDCEKLDTTLYQMPDFLRILAHFEKEYWEEIKKILQSTYVSAVESGKYYTPISVNMLDGSILNLEFIMHRKLTIGY